MLSKSNIRGIIFLLILLLATTLAVHFATRREGIQLREPDRSTEEQPRDTLFRFDPNTVTYEELLLLGVDKRTAVGIIKYRTSGKVFGIKEEFALCYGISDSLYRRLSPYISIDTKYATKPRTHRDTSSYHRRAEWRKGDKPRFSPRPFEKFHIDTVGVEYLRLIGFSTRQAEALLRYRESGGGIFSMNELRDCYAVSKEMADSLAHFIILSVKSPNASLLEINSADSASIRRLHGVGAKTVVAILQYRKLLGGFYSNEQIGELKCVTNANFALISKQIYCDSCNISKIDINFAPASEFRCHPYMTQRAYKQIVEQRESKGGWNSIEEMIEDKIFTAEQAKAIAPYLLFGTIPEDFD